MKVDYHLKLLLTVYQDFSAIFVQGLNVEALVLFFLAFFSPLKMKTQGVCDNVTTPWFLSNTPN